MGFLESGAKDIDGIMEALDNSNVFSTLAGMSSALLPFLFAFYGNPLRGIRSFVKKLAVTNTETYSEERSGGETFLQKLRRVRKEAPENYERFRLETIALTGNVVAGSDTTSISLTGTLYHVLTTEGVTARLYAELDSHGYGSDRSVRRMTFDQAQQLPYLQMVIKEGLRVHSAVALPMWREVIDSGLLVGETEFPPKVGRKIELELGAGSVTDMSTRPSSASILGLRTETRTSLVLRRPLSVQSGGIRSTHLPKSWRPWTRTTYPSAQARGLV